MAKVFAKIPNHGLKEVDANYVSDIEEAFELEGYTATVNRGGKSNDAELSDHDVVTFAKAVKGGM